MLNLDMLLIAFLTICHIVTSDPPEFDYIWEQSGKYQGDVLLPGDILPRNGYPSQFFGKINVHRWPFRTLVYDFDLTISDADKDIIEKTLQDYEYTNVKTRRKSWFDWNYVLVTNKADGCYSHIGRVGGAQILNLATDKCIKKNIILHEFTHALGFWHMHNDPSRDAYIEIMDNNIKENMKYAFEKMNTLSSYGVSYDKQSIMHFSNYAFAKDDLTNPNNPKMITIISKSNTHEKLGGESLSLQDVAKINQMYYNWF